LKVETMNSKIVETRLHHRLLFQCVILIDHLLSKI